MYIQALNAIKRIDLSIVKIPENEINNEINIQKLVSKHNEYSIKFYELMIEYKYYYLIMEKSESNLENLIKESKDRLDLKIIKKIM